MKKDKKTISASFMVLFALLSMTKGLYATDEDTTETATSSARFEISGFIAIKNIISTLPEQDFNDINRKNELRSSVNIRYGTDDLYINLVSNQYIIPLPINEEFRYYREFTAGRNGTLSGSFYEVNFREAYANISFEKARFRAGNQVYRWGTADVFNSTSYFNPYDLREILFKNDDELKQGVPSFSAMLFPGFCTIEIVFSPVHIPSRFAEADNFWEITYIEGPFPVHVINSDGMSIRAENFAYGGRVSGTVAGMDMSLSAYHGPDREGLMRPMRTVLTPGEPVSVEVMPEYHLVTSFGADASIRFDSFVLQAEASYTPHKTVCIDQPFTTGMVLPFETAEVRALTYSAGFNYFIPLSSLLEGHNGTTVFTAEWMQARYFGRGLMKPMLTDIITARLEDTFFEDRLKPSVTAIWDTKNSGAAFSAKLTWDFQNGFSVNAEYWNITGSNKSILGYFRENDFISIGGRYEY